MPTVSIIIPCYNKGKFIKETIDSVVNQKFTDWECVVVDDGSTDSETLVTLREINHDKIRVFFNTNQGVCSARNFAVSVSAGKYILPLDADDLIGSEFLHKAVPIIEECSDIKIISCDVQLFGKKKSMLPYCAFSMELLLARNLMVVTCLYRKVDFMTTSGYNPNMKYTFEDWDLWLSLLKTGGKVVHINEPLFYYRILPNSRNHIVTKDQFKYLRRAIFENHKELFSAYFMDPTETFEYKQIEDSLEYKIGKMVLKPIRQFIKLF